MIFTQFWAVSEKFTFFIFSPYKMVQSTWCMCERHNAQCGQHIAWCSQDSVWWGQHDGGCNQHNAWCSWHDGIMGKPGTVSDPPPYMEKNKLILNQYLGIFMHFETIFFLIWKMDFFRPTHPLNLENSRIFFFIFDPFPKGRGQKIIKKKFGIFQTLVGGWVWKRSFSKKKKNRVSKCIKLPKYSFKSNLFFSI